MIAAGLIAAWLGAASVGQALLAVPAGGPWTIRATAVRPVAVGPWALHPGAGANTLDRAVRALGPPDRMARPGGRRTECLATWRALGVRVHARSRGAAPGAAAACGRAGHVDTITLTGRRWRTERGLRVGMRRGTAVISYPHAVPWRMGGVRMLALVPEAGDGPRPAGAPYPLSARLGPTRLVTALVVRVALPGR